MQVPPWQQPFGQVVALHMALVHVPFMQRCPPVQGLPVPQAHRPLRQVSATFASRAYGACGGTATVATPSTSCPRAIGR